MGDLRVRIGPSVDRAAFDAAFSTVAASAKRAFEKVSADAQKSGTAQIRVAKTTATEVSASHDAVQRGFDAAERKKTQSAEHAARERASFERQYARDLEKSHRDAERSHKRMCDEMKKQAQEAGRVQAIALHGATSAVRFGMSIAGDLARGVGVNLDLGTAASGAGHMASMASQLSNAGYMPNDIRNNTRVDPSILAAQAYRVGDATGTAGNDVMAGMSEFVSKTGDLRGARDTIAELAKLSKATGSNLSEMAGAAADVSNQLGDVPNKGQLVNAVMRQIAGQGKLGAVEIKDLASQMAKVAANANMMEGDAGKNIAIFGALAQEARAKGGAASATQAATSIGSLMDTFSKGARLDAFQHAGVSVTGAGGKIRNIDDIIIDSLAKTQHGGDAAATNRDFGKLFASAQSRRAVRGFEETFRGAYANAGGSEQERLAEATKQTRAEMDRLTQAAMDQKDVDDSFARAMQTGQSSAEKWNNATQRAAGEMQTALLPALQQLVPVVVSVTGKLTSILGLRKPGDESANDAEHAQSLVRAANASRTKQLNESVAHQEKLLGRKMTPTELAAWKGSNKFDLPPELQSEINATDARLKGSLGAHQAAVKGQKADADSAGQIAQDYATGAYAAAFSGMEKVPWYLRASPVGGLAAGYGLVTQGAENIRTNRNASTDFRGQEQNLRSEETTQRALQQLVAALDKNTEATINSSVTTGGATNPSTDQLGFGPSGP